MKYEPRVFGHLTVLFSDMDALEWCRGQVRSEPRVVPNDIEGRT